MYCNLVYSMMDSQILTIHAHRKTLDVVIISTAGLIIRDNDGDLVMTVGRVLEVGCRDCSKICLHEQKKPTRKLSQDSH
jgi:hypothetical protein